MKKVIKLRCIDTILEANCGTSSPPLICDYINGYCVYEEDVGTSECVCNEGYTLEQSTCIGMSIENVNKKHDVYSEIINIVIVCPTCIFYAVNVTSYRFTRDQY